MELTKEKVKITPKEIEAVVIDIKEQLALEVYGNKTDNPEQPMVEIYWENAKEGIKGSDNLPYYEGEQLTDNTTLGKIILKYGEIKVGTKITVEKNDKGFYKIKK